MEPTRSILLCEEDATTRCFLADNLAADGYAVVACEDRLAALAELETRRPAPRDLRRQRRDAGAAGRRPPGATASPRGSTPTCR